MNIETLDNTLIVHLNAMMVLALACLLLAFSGKARERVPAFNKYCIPAPVIGGFFFAFLAWLLKVGGVMEFRLDGTLQSLFLHMFFVTIGLGTNLTLLKRGGKILVIYVACCWAVAFIQNGVSVGLASLLAINPLQALAAGATPLEGGHGLVAALCPVMEEAGGKGAVAIGMAAATYGLVAGSLIGGPVGNWLVRRHKVAITTDGQDWNRFGDAGTTTVVPTGEAMLKSLTLIILIVAVGTLGAQGLSRATGYAIPTNVFSLFCGLLFRSLNDVRPLVKMDFTCVNILSAVSLELFLTMAMMGLKIWELAGLAVPLIVILCVQTVVVALLAVFVMFRVCGRDYDAALLSAGFVGHALGATPNGLVVMDAVGKKFGLASPKAFFIIPVSGSMLVDIVGIPAIIFFINLLS